MKFTARRIVWIVFVVVVLCFHLLVGTLLAIATVFYWFLDRRLPPTPVTKTRLSDTPETQLAFRKAVSNVFAECGLQDVIPEEGVIHGAKFSEMIREISRNPLFENIKPEHVQQLVNFGTLLEACSRLGLDQPRLQEFVVGLFSPLTPTTPERADTMKEVVAGFVASIS